MSDVPFLGCKISLISKCDIRYEGILYCVDAKESTIALSKVKSYGTETRGDPSCYVAPKNDVYDIIIFRASDVKDLRVDAPEPPGLSDPAIISAHHSLPKQSPPTEQPDSHPKPSNNKRRDDLPSAGDERRAETAAAAVRMHRGGEPNRAPRGSGDNNTRGPRVGGNEAIRAPRGNENSRMPRGQENHNRVQRSGDRDNRAPRGGDNNNRGPPRGGDNTRMSRGGDNNNRGPPRGGDNDRGPRRNDGPRMNRGGHDGPDRRYNNSRTGGHMYRGRGGGQGGPVHGNRSGPPRGPRNALKFDGEYDFDGANKLFAELAGKLEGVQIKDGPNDNSESGSGYDSEDQNKDLDSKDGCGGSVNSEFYDKTKSFFDSISCEATERSQGKVNKPDWRKERQTNVETFGVSANYRRGGYRGYHRR